jgi:hypothetical protein
LSGEYSELEQQIADALGPNEVCEFATPDTCFLRIVLHEDYPDDELIQDACKPCKDRYSRARRR